MLASLSYCVGTGQVKVLHSRLVEVFSFDMAYTNIHTVRGLSVSSVPCGP